MLIVTGVLEVAGDDLTKARDAAAAMMVETRKEPGCLVYEFAEVLDQPGRFRIYEEWDSEAALEEHFRMPHMARFRDALADVNITSRDIFKVTGGRREAL